MPLLLQVQEQRQGWSRRLGLFLLQGLFLQQEPVLRLGLFQPVPQFLLQQVQLQEPGPGRVPLRFREQVQPRVVAPVRPLQEQAVLQEPVPVVPLRLLALPVGRWALVQAVQPRGQELLLGQVLQ